MKSEVRMRIAPLLATKGWVWDVEFLHRAKKLGYRMVEVPIEWRHALGGLEVSGTFKTSVKMFLELIALRLCV